MSQEYLTRRPTDAAYLDDDRFDPPASLLNLPWVDCHNHAHTLSWDDRERYALAGCRAMVMGLRISLDAIQAGPGRGRPVPVGRCR